MSDSSSQSTKVLIACAAAVAITGGLAYYYRKKITRNFFRTPRELSVEELITILSELNNKYHGILFEASQSVQRAEMIASQSGSNADPRSQLQDMEISSMLMDGGIGKKLETAQNEYLNLIDVTSEELATAVETFTNNDDDEEDDDEEAGDSTTVISAEQEEEISRLLKGLDDMVYVYLDGGVPAHPECREFLSSKLLGMILSEIMVLKEKRIGIFFESLGNDFQAQIPDQSVFDKMSEISYQVESEICAKHQISQIQLLSSVAHSTNSSGPFRKQLLGLLMKHQTLPQIIEQ